MSKLKKFLIIGALIYIVLFILYKFYIFNGAFEWFKNINTFYFLLLFVGLIIYFAKLFSKKPESMSDVENTSGSFAGKPMGSGASNSGLVIAFVNLSAVILITLYTMIFGFDIYVLVGLYLILLLASLVMSIIASFLNKKSLIKKRYAIYLIWSSPIILFIALVLIISGLWVTTYH